MCASPTPRRIEPTGGQVVISMSAGRVCGARPDFTLIQYDVIMEILNVLPDEIYDNHAFCNILERVSVRSYKDAPVPDPLVSALLHAAMSAPSGVNRQPWEFVVVDDRAKLDRLADALPYAKMTANAPLAIAVCGNPARFLDGVDDVLWEQDLSAASENILLAAHALGLGGVWTCLFPHEERMKPVRDILEIPADIMPFCLIPVGYPERSHAPMDKWHPDRVHINSYLPE